MNQKFFRQETYHTRRAALASKLKKGIILIPSNEESGMNYKDNAYPFRQDSTFLYYCGINRAGLFLLIDCTTGESILAGNELTVEDIVWTGPTPSLVALADLAAIDKVIDYTSGINYVQQMSRAGNSIHYLPIYRGDQAFKISEITACSPQEVYHKHSPELCMAVVHQREIKTTEELEELTEAVNLSGDMHTTMMKVATVGMSEANVMANVRAACLSQNVDISYPIILSVNGQTLHNHAYHNTLQEGQLLLGDFGAESKMQYAGDITRTIPVSKSFNAFQKEIYQIVLDTLLSSISMVRNGMMYKDIHLQAARIITNGMKSLGFLKGDIDEIVHAGAHALFFPHGLGHPLGLDVHDMEGIGEEYTGYEGGLERSKQFGLKSLRLAKTLKTGMVITVEPGIYFIPELISLWKSENKYSQFINYSEIEKRIPFGGIRIEDNVVVRDKQGEILGKPIPKTIEEVESLRAFAYV